METLETIENVEDYTFLLETIADNQDTIINQLADVSLLLGMTYKVILYILVALCAGFLWRLVTRWISSAFQDTTKL